MAVLGAALLAVAIAVWQLERGRQGLSISALQWGGTPVTVFRPAPAPAPPSAAAAAAARQPAPVVLIAHGFAGSQQLMQPLAQTLARNGFVAITFGFPGHGRNSAPMKGGLSDQEQSQRTLLASMRQMGGYARAWAAGNGIGSLGIDSHSVDMNGHGRYAVIGHSMASDIVVRHAQAHPEVLASVGVSLFAPSIQADTPANSPRNLLVTSGAWEPAMMASEALRVVGRAIATQPLADTTYGRFEDGTARRATQAAGVEHIGVLYSADTLNETLAWLNTAFGRAPARDPFIDSRGPWLGLLMLGVVALTWPLSQLLPVLLTLLLLWKLPSDFLPLLLSDYLMLHFALYGLPLMAALCAGTLPYFWADEWLTREGLAPHSAPPRAAYLFSKLCFLLSLVAAIALNPERLFFLALIVPAVLLMFVVYGLFSRWVFKRTGLAAVGATANALAFGCFMGATFPIVA